MKVKIGPYPTHRWYHNWLFEKFGWSSKQKVKVRIDDYDSWSMDHTLAHIIVPMLKQLKETKQGGPWVDYNDVPEELRPNEAEVELYKTKGETDTYHWARWDWVMDEMIFAFESKLEDWEEQFQSGNWDISSIERADGLFEWVDGPNNTFKIDWAGRMAYQERISNGFRLFGKYYENLWD